MAQDDDISNAINIARRDTTADAIQSKINGLNQNLAGLDLEANVPQFNTGLTQPQIGGAGFIPHGDPQRNENLATWHQRSHPFLKDENNNPKVLYHGTASDFSKFGRSITGEFGPGIYASDLPQEASDYAGTHSGNQNVMPIHMNLKNPFVPKHAHEFWDKFGGENDDEAMYNAMAAGHDGVIYQRPHVIYDPKTKDFINTGTQSTHYIAFSPNQIKSATGNNGQFDPSNPDITKANGGRTRYSLDGMVKPNNNTIEMPHSLKELQDWHKTHSAPKPMVRASDDPTSILYNERKLDMPNSLEELQNWARTHHASGGSIDHIAKAMHLARKHFEDGGGEGGGGEGGESGESRDREWTRDYNSSLGASDNADNSGSKSDNPRADSLAQSQQASDDAQRAADIRANNQDVSRFAFGNDVNLNDVNLTGHDMPRGLVDYTEQRLNTPYEGTLLSSAMDPSTAYGMSYPELVGRQLSKTGAQAFLANLGYESTQGGKVFNPQAVSGSGYGLAQWTDPKRQQEFFSAMMQPGQAMPQTAQEKRNLLATTTPQQQLGYALKEALSGGYGPSAQAMTTPGNLADKVATIARNYEGAGIPAIGNRVALANQIAADKGYGTFAQNTFSDAPSSVYAANVPTPIARPEDLNPAQAAAVAQNIPTPTARPSDLGQTVASTPSADPYGTAKIAEMARAILSAQRPNAPTPSVSATRNTLPFIGSTEDPELIARQQAMLLAMRGYASGGKVNDDISHALRIAASMGRGNDSILAHINPREAALLKKHGGSGKINPHTGLIEFDDNEGGNENNDNAQADAKDPDASYHDMMNQPGWGSEDPGLIAGFNANNAAMGYGNTGPQSTRGEIAVGQTVPDTMVPGVDAKGNYAMQPSLGSKISDFLSGIFNPSFVGVNSPGYAKMAEQKDAPPSANNPGNKGGDNIIPPIRPIPQAGTVAAADVLPTTPYVAQTPYIPPTPQPYASLGANFVNPSVYQNPYLTRFLATGGKVHGNNAMGNALRMAMANKP